MPSPKKVKKTKISSAVFPRSSFNNKNNSSLPIIELIIKRKTPVIIVSTMPVLKF
jgi:hypothetical protein